MGDIAFRAAASGTPSSSGGTCAVPSGTVVGDLLVAAAACSNLSAGQEPSFALSGGAGSWTKRHSITDAAGNNITSFTKFAEPSDIGATITAADAVGGQQDVLSIAAYSGVASVGALGAGSAATGSPATSTVAQVAFTGRVYPVYIGRFGGSFPTGGDTFTTTAPSGLRAATNITLNYFGTAIADEAAHTTSSPSPARSFTATQNSATASSAVLLLVPSNTAPGAPGTPTVTPTTVGTTAQPTGTIAWSAASDVDGQSLLYAVDLSLNNGASWTTILTGVSGTSTSYDFSAAPSTTTARVRILAFDGVTYGPASASSGLFTISHNVAPNAPGSLLPSGTTVERLNAQRLSWAFSDANAGDTQSQARVWWRLGTGSWNTVTLTTPNQYWDAPSSTFPAGSIEWQVETADSQGVYGPKSASAFFTAATTPGVPTITTPTNGSTISVGSGVLAWSTPAQESYQLRRVADNAGSPDTSTVLYDSGEVVSVTARNAAMSWPTNNQFEHDQIRIKNSGLWSSWASVRVQVSYTPPLNPTLLAIAMDGAGAIQVSVTNPLGNLLTANQASVETDTAGWTAVSNTTLARSTAQALTGAASLSLTSVAAGDINAATPTGTAGVPITGGQVYTAVASFRAAAAARSTQLALFFYDASGTVITSPNSAVFADNTAGWTQAYITYQAPANAAYARIRCTVLATSAASEVHYVDAVGLFTDPVGNLVTTADEEDGTTGGWAGIGTSAVTSSSTAQAYTGTRSVLLTVTTAGASGTRVARKLLSGLVIGTTYTVSSYAYIGGLGGATGALFRWINAAQSTVLAQSTAVTTVGSWQRSTITFTATETSAYLDWTHTGATTGTFTLYIDAVQAVIGSAAQPWVPPTTSNLVTNPSFEVDTSGWNTGARDTTRAYVGIASLRWDIATGTNVVQANAVTVAAGVQHVFSAKVWLAAPVAGTGGGGLYMDVVGPGGFDSPNFALDQSKVGQWQTVTGTFTPTTSGAANLRVVSFGATGTGTLWLDAVQVEYGSVATPYLDGSLGAGYRWTGTPHASTSIREYPWTTPPAPVASNDIWRRETGDAGPGIRVATALGGNGTWTDYTPASGVDYEYQAAAVATNGTAAASAWTS